MPVVSNERLSPHRPLKHARDPDCRCEGRRSQQQNHNQVGMPMER